VVVLERFHLVGILQNGKRACNKKIVPLNIKVKPILLANNKWLKYVSLFLARWFTY